MSTAVSHTRVAVAGAEPRLLQAGPTEDAEAVVFVHGNPGSADDWERLAGAVAETGLRAVALDLPDFGESAAPPGFEHSVAAHAAVLGEALATLGIERVHLVGHDFGGPIGLSWAAAHSEALASTTLIDIGLLPGYRWHRAARVWRTPVLGELFQAVTTRAGFRWAINREEPRGLPREFIDEMYDHYDHRTRRAVLKLYRATDDLGAGAAEFGRSVGPCELPALVIWGEHDAYLPARYAARQRDLFPEADIHILPASGHWPYKDAAETVERLLVDFLASAAGVKQA